MGPWLGYNLNNIKKDKELNLQDKSYYLNIAKDRKVIPDPIDDRKFQE